MKPDLSVMVPALVAGVVYYFTDSWFWAAPVCALAVLLYPLVVRPRGYSTYTRTSRAAREYREKLVARGVQPQVHPPSTTSEEVRLAWTNRSRTLRFFVSSTFADMMAERDELAKFVFPAIRQMCAERGVMWGDVDLRWGITDEQKAEGRVLPVCLAEVELSRPHFIGLLGERYGWVPALTKEDIQAQPWLRERAGCSITELEIEHGVFAGSLTGHAYFYFRSPPPRDTSEPTERVHHVEADQEGAQKLASLKERIRTSGAHVTEGFHDERDLGQAVLRDLTALVEALYPAEDAPSALVRDITQHAAYEQSRASVYAGRAECYSWLDAAADRPSACVVTGAPGSGKSALLTNWSHRRRGADWPGLLVARYIGASADSTNWASLVRGMMEEIIACTGMSVDIPEASEAMPAAFATMLERVGSGVTLVLDGLDQLEDVAGALTLSWLPQPLPSNVTVIASSGEGIPLTEARRREWDVLLIEPLTGDERRSVIREVVARRSRRLGSAVVERIAQAPQSGNPLFLTTLVGELQVVGQHELLEARTQECLGVDSPAALFGLVLDRLSVDYGRDVPGLVPAALTLIWAARRGLAEQELLDLLGSGEDPLRHAAWSPLHLALAPFLVNRDGVLNFFHAQFRVAVEERYLRTQEARTAAHLRLADYFSDPVRLRTERSIQELTELLYQAKAWDRLRTLYSDTSYVGWVYSSAPLMTNSYWAALEKESPTRMVDVYAGVVLHPETYSAEELWAVAALLSNFGYPDRSLALQQAITRLMRATSEPRQLVKALANEGITLMHLDRVSEALGPLSESLRLEGEVDAQQSSVTLNTLGSAYMLLGRADWAAKLLEEAIQIAEITGDVDGRMLATGSLGIVARRTGKPQLALILHAQQVELAMQQGDISVAQLGVGNIGAVHLDRGDAAPALECFKQQEDLCRTVGDLEHLKISLRNQSLALNQLGRADDARAASAELEKIESIGR